MVLQRTQPEIPSSQPERVCGEHLELAAARPRRQYFHGSGRESTVNEPPTGCKLRASQGAGKMAW